MKIKLVGPGWTGFTGHFGVTEFVDGVSVHDVSQREAQHLAAVTAVESLEGHDPSAAQQILDHYKDRAPVVNSGRASAEEVPQVEAKPSHGKTAEELMALADKGGIKALRALADPLGLKGNSIKELLGKLTALIPAEGAAKTPESGPSGPDVAEHAAEEVAATGGPIDPPAGE